MKLTKTEKAKMKLKKIGSSYKVKTSYIKDGKEVSYVGMARMAHATTDGIVTLELTHAKVSIEVTYDQIREMIL